MSDGVAMINLMSSWRFDQSAGGKFEVSNSIKAPIKYGPDVLTQALSVIRLPSSVKLNNANSMAFMVTDLEGMNWYLIITSFGLSDTPEFMASHMFNSISPISSVSILQVKKSVSCSSDSFPIYNCDSTLSPVDVWLYLPKGVPIPGGFTKSFSKEVAMKMVVVDEQ